MASACRAAAAALVKSFPPAVAAPFCMLVGGDLLRQHEEFRGICWRKTFQESPRKVSGRRQRPGASPCLAVPRRASLRRCCAPCAGSPEKFSSNRCRDILHAGEAARPRPMCRRARRRLGENFSPGPPPRRGRRSPWTEKNFFLFGHIKAQQQYSTGTSTYLVLTGIPGVVLLVTVRVFIAYM